MKIEVYVTPDPLPRERPIGVLITAEFASLLFFFTLEEAQSFADQLFKKTAAVKHQIRQTTEPPR